MYQRLLGDARLYLWMERVDGELAEIARQEGCRTCRGRLHQADYPRKPRGTGCEVGDKFEQRRSFCCAHRECRKRTTPPSVRFFGRKVYLGAVFVLCMTMQHGVRNGRAQQLGELLRVSRQTLVRWRVYWQQTFVQTPFWRHARTLLSPLVAECELPTSLLQRFSGDPMSQLIFMLRFIAPLTSGSAGPTGGGS